MQASFVELRTKSREIIEALKRNERVTVLYRGRPTAVMHPIREPADRAAAPRAADHPAFGMWKDRAEMSDVSAYVRSLRQGRFGAL